MLFGRMAITRLATVRKTRISERMDTDAQYRVWAGPALAGAGRGHESAGGAAHTAFELAAFKL